MMMDPIDRHVRRQWARESSWGRRRRTEWIIIIALVLVVLAATFLLIRVAAAETGWIMCMPDGEVNVRSRATTHSSRIGLFGFGDRIEVDRTSGSWVHSSDLALETASGWISADYVVYDRPTAIPEGQMYVVQASGRVAVWTGLGARKRACWLQPGDQIMVYAVSAYWALTGRGYVRMIYLNPK